MINSPLVSIDNNNKPIIALDCDGVLLDYQTTFGQIYTKTFGKQVDVVSPKAYHVSTIITCSIVKAYSYRLRRDMV